MLTRTVSLGVVLLASIAVAADRLGNGPYVLSAMHGMFYAKSVPAEKEGTKGQTRIYRVQKDADDLLDTYEWHAPWAYQPALTLGWSPIAGKIAVMRLHNEPAEIADDRLELSFYIGGKHLKSYTSKELIALGAKQQDRRSKHDLRSFLDFKIVGCEQTHNTNEYQFVIAMPDGASVRFDILTGEIVK